MITLLAQPTDNSKRGRREVVWFKLFLFQLLVGRFFLEYGHSYVVADDSLAFISHDIQIPTEHKGGARMGNVVT
ncbi:hypothetical protein O9929_01285 [Vibrio lentus]|nr:hypothetical protein [Vibrio lentus]